MNARLWASLLSDVRLSLFEQCLFEKENAAITCEATHQMLRALEHEVPPQMRKADEIYWIRSHECSPGL
ncbi:MAG TPA: hypothetical protein VM715_23080, partial [Candidatus Acidoferrum sp.]|nr:hypothetical protein [Candidatus Acidoferrum sp.]